MKADEGAAALHPPTLASSVSAAQRRLNVHLELKKITFLRGPLMCALLAGS